MPFQCLLPWKSEVVRNLLSWGKEYTLWRISSNRNLLLLRGTTLSPDPPLGNLPLVTFTTALSFGEVNLPLRKEELFLKEHSLNLPASFSLRAMSLPRGGVEFSIAISLGGTNLSLGELTLPFRESLISLENRLCYFVSCCIPSIDFSLDGGSIQTVDHSFFRLSTLARQYLGTHTFLGESFPSFFDSINALKSKMEVLIKALVGKDPHQLS